MAPTPPSGHRPAFLCMGQQATRRPRLATALLVATSLRADLPGALSAAIEGCLQKDPAQRFQAARDVRAALERFRDYA